ncbi:MAG: tRNA (adenosine(37)-N6)-threonylcarbamoyltransferase complex dimerization subunit type 1 TsaB [Candidatus Buchananbacteria bacterium]|nr:tRNA (adenosine(37)-N6)-threonylcarbamoyltransferase complex dimerization subunit type 1 TsaB [Candidatus Buchananbacteria bacterium]
MILFIDTADLKQLTIAVVQKDKIVDKKIISAQYRQSEKLLPGIDQLLRKNKLNLKKLTGLAVVVGPGPFTAIRIGIATANALAFSLNLPILSLDKKDIVDINQLPDLISKKNHKKISKLAVPKYGKEPNITIK